MPAGSRESPKRHPVDPDVSGFLPFLAARRNPDTTRTRGQSARSLVCQKLPAVFLYSNKKGNHVQGRPVEETAPNRKCSCQFRCVVFLKFEHRFRFSCFEFSVHSAANRSVVLIPRLFPERATINWSSPISRNGSSENAQGLLRAALPAKFGGPPNALLP